MLVTKVSIEQHSVMIIVVLIIFFLKITNNMIANSKQYRHSIKSNTNMPWMSGKYYLMISLRKHQNLIESQGIFSQMEKFAFDGNDSVLFPVNPSFHDKPCPDSNSNLSQFSLSHESLFTFAFQKTISIILIIKIKNKNKMVYKRIERYEIYIELLDY